MLPTAVMAKEKIKGTKGPPNKHLSARIAFLQQAALHLARSRSHGDGQTSTTSHGDSHIDNSDGKDLQSKADPATPSHPAPNGLAAHLALQLRQVALKSVIRMQPSTKHFSCKVCHTVLLEGQTCNKYTENLSRGGRKPHADVTVHECTTCGTKKRFPMNAKRQPRKGMRKHSSPEERLPLDEAQLELLPI